MLVFRGDTCRIRKEGVAMVKGFSGRLKNKKSQKVPKEVRELFLGEGSEAITEELINELVGKGWNESQLRSYQKEGALYSRPRNTILYPPDFGSSEDFQ
jgi:hypothetical protein